MQAKVQQRGEIVVVQVSGQLTIEKNEEFRRACLRGLAGRKVVFALDGLQFVGSSGIQGFFRVIGEVHAGTSHGVKIAGLSADFLRLFQYTQLAGLEIHENVDKAVTRFETLEPASR